MFLHHHKPMAVAVRQQTLPMDTPLQADRNAKLSMCARVPTLPRITTDNQASFGPQRLWPRTNSIGGFVDDQSLRCGP